VKLEGTSLFEQAISFLNDGGDSRFLPVVGVSLVAVSPKAAFIEHHGMRSPRSRARAERSAALGRSGP
jgi:hypothetical protein